jgi:hypothetical protein
VDFFKITSFFLNSFLDAADTLLDGKLRLLFKPGGEQEKTDWNLTVRL